MNKHLINIFGIFLLIIAHNSESQNSASKVALIEFKELTKKHMDDWMDHAKSVHNKEMEIKKSHRNQWLELGISALKSIPEKCELDSHFKRELNEALKLREKQKNEWQKFRTESQKETAALFKKHEDEFDEYKQKNGLAEKVEPKPAPAPAATPVEPTPEPVVSEAELPKELPAEPQPIEVEPSEQTEIK